MKWNQHPELREGDRVQCFDSGCVYRVGRVTQSSATLTEEYTRPKTVTLTDRAGNERTFEASSGGKSIQVSPRAMMRRLA